MKAVSMVYQKSVKVGRICWKGKFWARSGRVKEWQMLRVVMMTKMGWQLDEEVNRNKTDEADGMNLAVYCNDVTE